MQQLELILFNLYLNQWFVLKYKTHTHMLVFMGNGDSQA